MKDNIKILNKNYDLLLYLIPILNKFPRNQKFLLSDRIENSLLDNQELILKAYYSKQKLEYLNSVNIKLENLRYLVRLCFDLKLFSQKRYEFISKAINDIGLELGSWIKYINYAQKIK